MQANANSDARLQRMRELKHRICLTDEERYDFDKLMIGALSVAAPDLVWNTALEAAQVALEVMRVNGGKVPQNLGGSS